ncbi:MAG: LexA family protein, partial [Vampirovibrionales bacterium]
MIMMLQTPLHPYLTPKQSQFFDALKHAYGRQPLPSMDTIAKAFGFQHKNSVWQYFKVFKAHGFILEENRRLFINPAYFGAALIDTPIRAGLPSSTEASIERRVSLDETFNLDHPDTVLFKVSGDSMTGLG